MVFVVGLAIIFATLAFVAYPLIKPSRRDAFMQDEMEDELQFKKDATYSALKELEFDYALGNLSPEDHRDLEDKYKEKAINILKDMDGLQTKPAERRVPDIAELDDVEREVLRVRHGTALDLEEEIMAARGKKAAGVSHRAVQSLTTCPSCDKKVAVTAKFCSSCGAALSLACPSCGKTTSKGSKFCSECGAKLSEEVAKK